jgi:hypothetical protein
MPHSWNQQGGKALTTFCFIQSDVVPWQRKALTQKKKQEAKENQFKKKENNKKNTSQLKSPRGKVI